VTVSIDEVKLWATDKGIGHAVSRIWKAHYAHTACDILANFRTTPVRPKRICRKCRARLRFATLSTSSKEG
jgi:hypothetical protein